MKKKKHWSRLPIATPEEAKEQREKLIQAGIIKEQTSGQDLLQE